MDYPHYLGKRYGGEASVLIEREPGAYYQLNPRNDLRNHSPDGFEWGYLGSGPAQLALAICCDVLDDDELATRVYQHFKQRLIARLDRDADWVITTPTARAVIDEIIKEYGIDTAS